MKESSSKGVTLNDGTTMPAVGFGTYQLNGTEGSDVVASAIKTGYRLLDSAFNYENEGAVGEAVRKSGVKREEVLITSKLPGRHHAYREAIATVEESVYRARVEYLDLYLIHWPNPVTGKYVEAWQALIEMKRRGLVRSIGVCNFLPEHIDTLVKETGVWPSVNQIELHPYFPQETQRRYDASHGIITQAWSPLGRAGKLREDPVLKALAEKKHRSPSQIVLRWHHQLGNVPLPKATAAERQRENLSLFDFELNEAEMQEIAKLSRPDGRLANQDPARYEEF